MNIDDDIPVIPDWIDDGWFHVKCPECGERWWYSHWLHFFYPLHYAEVHLGIKAFRSLR